MATQKKSVDEVMQGLREQIKPAGVADRIGEVAKLAKMTPTERVRYHKQLLVETKGGEFVPLAADLAESEKLPKDVCEAAVKLGFDIMQGHAKLGQQYVDLVLVFRKNSVNPKQVSNILGALGFKRSRISEINRVVSAAPTVFKQLEAREIGFRDALETARGGAPLDVLQLTEGEAEDLEAGNLPGSAVNQSGVTKRKSLAVKIVRGLKPVAMACGKDAKKLKFPLVYNKWGNGIVITITFEKPVKAVPAAK